ncbi:hypothetical protein CPF_1589 [Clostridium perfringens ATCC 13124]|uniref:Uncharacterized protein n=1 Tax=Clostridium perfringens (strain ATCC 13124 / DSM 756 / JCM 1290 / NCIMB 6125 / NCTC 8237 / Type A) TaxID=195103 RepID=A0A0H2YUY3_CLOP1|nr:hypothetical protein [Clostridium perfringens]ABG84896.1 hypothetical protein CPF_1589 [Clostridium perfringens ATCC 13124]
MDKKTIIKNISISLGVISILVYASLFSIWKVWGNHFKVAEWIIFCATVVTTLIGAYATIIAVLISIEYSKNQKNVEQKEKLRRINIIVYTELLEYINSVKEDFFYYIFEAGNTWGVKRVSEDFRFIIPEIKSNVKDLIYELMIYDTNESIIIIKKIYDLYIENKRLIDKKSNHEVIIEFLLENILNDEYKKTVDCTTPKLKFVPVEDTKLKNNIEASNHMRPTELREELIPQSQEESDCIDDFVEKYKENTSLIKVNEEIEGALKYLLGAIKN